mgnify:CR=1 FL=1
MKREQILLLVVLLLLALMSWSLFSDEGVARVRPGVRSMELPRAGGVEVVVDFDLEDSSRDVFREPRETEPLEPLPLVLPPLEAMATLLPPPIPDSGADYWSRHLLLTPGPLPGDINELVTEDGVTEDSEYASLDESQASGTLESSEEDLLKLYDSVRINGLDQRWGRILNDDRYSLISGSSDLVFQEVDPATGSDRFSPSRFAPENYVSFRFADTLRNQIEIRVRALPQSSGSIENRLESIAWLLDQGHADSLAFTRAESVAEKTTELSGEDIQTWLALGDVWERTFKWDRAFSLYAGMAGIQASRTPLKGIQPQVFARSSAPRARLGRILERLGMDSEAETQYRSGVDLSDGNPEVLQLLGRLLTRTGRAMEAIPLLQQADRQYRPRRAPGALANGVALGEAYLAVGDFESAAQAFGEVQRTGGAAAQVLDASAGGAASAYLSGQFSDALSQANDAIEIFGADWKLLYMRGIAAAANGEPAGEVVRDLRAASKSAGLDAAPALAALAFWLNSLGHDEDAQEKLDEALKLSPKLPYARYLRARWARENHDLSSANEDLRFLISYFPRCGAVLGELAWLLNQEGRHALAEVAFRRAVGEAPEWGDASLRRGLNLLQLNQVEEARVSLSQVEDSNLENARQNALAWAAYLEGDVQAAVGEFALLQDNLRSQEEHPQAVFADTWQRRIQERSSTVRWTDDFNGQIPRPQWDVRTAARNGVEPRVRGGSLRIAGTHAKAGETRAFRALRALSFRSASCLWTVGNGHRGEAGVGIALESRRRRSWGFQVFRAHDSGIRWKLTSGAKGKMGELNQQVIPGQLVEVRFALDREVSPPELVVWVGQEEAYRGPEPRLKTPTGDIILELFANTVNALPVDVALDQTELVYIQE